VSEQFSWTVVIHYLLGSTRKFPVETSKKLDILAFLKGASGYAFQGIQLG
jgi:hypothetical protein